jgi:nucleotide-binding universal stress UspA family protein
VKEIDMSTTTPRPVVVGVDDRSSSGVALDWAIDEASRRHLPVHLLHARQDPPGSRLATPASGPERSQPGVLTEAVAHVRTLAPGLRVTSEVSTQKPSAALVDASRRAACLVVGARGRGALMGTLLGSTSLDVAAHAACPVVVARCFPEVQPARPGVVVGADGSELSAEAIGYAFAQAAERQLPLTVVHVWSTDFTSAYRPADLGSDPVAQTEEEQALAAQEVAGWAERYPEVTVNRHVLSGHPVKALVDHSRGAELVVVGSRGRGGFAGMLLGSVSQGVLQHAHCPVAVVRAHSG